MNGSLLSVPERKPISEIAIMPSKGRKDKSGNFTYRGAIVREEEVRGSTGGASCEQEK